MRAAAGAHYLITENVRQLIMFVEGFNFFIIQEEKGFRLQRQLTFNTDRLFYKLSGCINEEYLHLII